MENMIKRIIDADNEAKELEKKTVKEKALLNKSIDDEADKIYQKYMSDANETVKLNNKAEIKKAKDEWENIKNKHQSVLVKLDFDYEQDFDKWVDEIVKRTIEM